MKKLLLLVTLTLLVGIGSKTASATTMGDANNDGTVGIPDLIAVLNNIFGGPALACPAAGDPVTVATDPTPTPNGVVNTQDAIFIINHLPPFGTYSWPTLASCTLGGGGTTFNVTVAWDAYVPGDVQPEGYNFYCRAADTGGTPCAATPTTTYALVNTLNSAAAVQNTINNLAKTTCRCMVATAFDQTGGFVESTKSNQVDVQPGAALVARSTTPHSSGIKKLLQ